MSHSNNNNNNNRTSYVPIETTEEYDIDNNQEEVQQQQLEEESTHLRVTANHYDSEEENDEDIERLEVPEPFINNNNNNYTSSPPVVGSVGSSSSSSSSSTTNTRNNNNNNPTFVLPEKEIPPPDYYDFTLPPPYSPDHNTATISESLFIDASGSSDADELLIDGLPVGHPFLLVINLFLTLAFDFVGFLLTYLLATTHSARAGSRLGFGLTLIRYGLYIRYADQDQEMLAYKYYDNTISPAEIRAQNSYMSYLLMILGFLVILFANADYYRVNKIRNLILQSASSSSDISRMV